MKTDVLPVNAASIEKAASLIRAGEVVAFPTETVYGLGADAGNNDAVLRIFAAKDRPADNPLICHVASKRGFAPLVSSVPKLAAALIEAFWPGPLTLVFPKSAAVPDAVTAGLSTVAVRMPSHPAALALIEAAGCPVAAPSANRSTRPSPTTASHVLADLDGRIPLILDGGPALFGVESTVVDVNGGVPTILRPGGLTLEMLREIVPDILVDRSALSPLRDGAEARSPGMRHRHYAPRAKVVVVRGGARLAREMRARYAAAVARGGRPLILCRSDNAARYDGLSVYPLGGNAPEMAARLFDALRAADDAGYDLILAEAAGTDGIGLALMNRLLRAADFDIVDA